MFEERTILMMFYSGLLLIFVLALLSHFRKMAIINRGLYKPRRSDWSGDWRRIRDGLGLMVIGGVLAAGIYYDLNGWVIFWLIVAGVGLSRMVGGLVRR